MNVFKAMSGIALLAWVCFAMVVWAQNQPVKSVPVLAEAEKTKIREFQLRDVRVSDAIKQRQLEIVNLQTTQQQNVREFQAFVAGLCKSDGYEFDASSDVLQCAKKKPATPAAK